MPPSHWNCKGGNLKKKSFWMAQLLLKPFVIQSQKLNGEFKINRRYICHKRIDIGFRDWKSHRKARSVYAICDFADFFFCQCFDKIIEVFHKITSLLAHCSMGREGEQERTTGK